MKVYFATWIDFTFSGVLTNKDAGNRLVSYFFIREQKVSPKQITEYITQGVIKK